MLGDLVLLERDNKNTLSVEGVELIMTDIMATNGVIHVVSDVIIPSAAKKLSDVLKQRKLTKLLTMLESAKLVIILILASLFLKYVFDSKCRQGGEGLLNFEKYNLVVEILEIYFSLENGG